MTAQVTNTLHTNTLISYLTLHTHPNNLKIQSEFGKLNTLNYCVKAYRLLVIEMISRKVLMKYEMHIENLLAAFDFDANAARSRSVRGEARKWGLHPNLETGHTASH